MNKHILFLLLLTVGTFSYAQKNPAQLTQGVAPAVTHALERAACQAATQNMLAASQLALTRSIFRAYPQGQTGVPPLSGFVFKTTYDDKEEIFGVIAQHAMPTKNNHGRIGQSFTARISQGDQEIDLPAQVVAMTSPSMPDMALVKFRSEDEKLLQPLTLAEWDPAKGDPVQLVGFGDGQLTLMPASSVQENTLISVRFPINNERDARLGMGGSPALNTAGEVTGMFTGSVYHTPIDIGYVTKVSYLQSLVDAYHDEGTFPFILGEDVIIDLDMDEFISAIRLEDDHGNTVYRRTIEHKFPYNTIMKHLPKTRYVVLSINRVYWNGVTLSETDASDAYHVVYDLWEKKIVREGTDPQLAP